MTKTILNKKGKVVAQIKVIYECEIFGENYNVRERQGFDNYDAAKEWVKNRTKKAVIL